MAFTVFTSEDRTPQGSTFGDNDSFSIRSSGVLEVASADYGVRIYAPGFWQLVTVEKHDIGLRSID